jgi:hemolysin activation/secretion protein
MKHVQWILAFVLVLGAGSLGAQGVVPPSTSDPARLRERMEVPAGPPVPVRLPEFKATPQEPLPAAVRALRVRLSAIEVEGSTVYTRAQWQAQTQGYVGREVSGEEIFALAQTLTARYRNDGYFLSVVLVPAQSLTDGVLT